MVCCGNGLSDGALASRMGMEETTGCYPVREEEMGFNPARNGR